jgi:hypothetical protein
MHYILKGILNGLLLLGGLVAALAVGMLFLWLGFTLHEKEEISIWWIIGIVIAAITVCLLIGFFITQ